MKTLVAICLSLLTVPVLFAQGRPSESTRIAETILTTYPDGRGGVWNYDEGTMLEGMDGAWYATSNGAYFRYIQHCVDRFVGEDGSIRTYKANDQSLDMILMGRQLILLAEVTGKRKYYKAATLLYEQLKHQPRVPEGGFWHKKRYPNQMWLDGLYMAEPFYAEYAARYHHPEDFDDIAKQFELVWEHTRDPKTGLLFHAWDEDKKQPWANKRTGDSPMLWSRAMGWYGMALVDVLPYIPENHPAHRRMVEMLREFAKAVVAAQGHDGVWWQVTDRPGAKGNYEESSGSAMFVYMLEKGVREGWLPESDRRAAERGYRGVLKTFVKTDGQGRLELTGTADAVGLGGVPYRDGSYAYYTSVKRVNNDARGLGALLLAANEMEMIPTLRLGKGQTVLLDSWYNSETHADLTGRMVPYHYKWEELANNGLSFFAHAWHSYGVKTKTLYRAPTAADLAGVQIYIIMDPNFATTPKNPHYNPNPHYMTEEDAKVIADWVRKGGTLLLFNNDEYNADFDHLNLLAERFGITFHKDIRNRVNGRDFEMGALDLTQASAVFARAGHVYMKEICTLGTKAPATPLLTDHGDTLMATAKLGSGHVFAVGDPWFYNEYTDGRKLPPSFQNYLAAQDLIRWSVEQTPRRSH